MRERATMLTLVLALSRQELELNLQRARPLFTAESIRVAPSVQIYCGDVGRVSGNGLSGARMASGLRAAIKRLGEPVIRTAVGRAMREMGRQFVLGETIQAAMERAATMEKKGYSYSYDMLGEAARTSKDAERYHRRYLEAIDAVGKVRGDKAVELEHGVSVKLSALHPKYLAVKEEQVVAELYPRLLEQAKLEWRRVTEMEPDHCGVIAKRAALLFPRPSTSRAATPAAFCRAAQGREAAPPAEAPRPRARARRGRRRAGGGAGAREEEEALDQAERAAASGRRGGGGGRCVYRIRAF